ncbi:MAG: tetratricopeptide repeat protein [Rhodospirillales bacterium]|nr:tetratricopeptide repeat protein [Rhodospirillales bacterium]
MAEDIFREVDEDLRRDRAVQLWKRYGNWVIAGALALVIGTAGYVAWQDWQRRQAEADGVRFVTALDLIQAGNRDRAAISFADIARTGRAGYAVLARFYEAALLAQTDIPAAIATYREIAADSSVDREMRDIATILAALNAIDSPGAGDAVEDLAALAGSASPWRFTALEIAAISAMKKGEMGKAKESYTKISDDPAAPAGIRARAAEMLAAFGG